jgi:hypothetical protein
MSAGPILSKFVLGRSRIETFVDHMRAARHRKLGGADQQG